MSRLNWRTRGRATAYAKVKDAARNYAMRRNVARMRKKKPQSIVLDYAAVAERLKRRDTS